MKLLNCLLVFFLIAFSTEANCNDARKAYSNGEYEKAFNLFLEEAKQGIAPSQFQLALMYRDGLGTNKNLPEALKWQEKAAKQSYRPSLNELGVVYLYGHGTSPDLKKALHFLQRCHDLDWPPCSEALARIYIYGEGGIEKDFEKAKPYLLHGVEEGMPASLFLLSQMYLRGVGYEANEYLGVMLLIESANAGFDKAKKEIEHLKKKIKMPLKKYMAAVYGYTAPLEKTKVCITPTMRRLNCTVFWDD